jgi:mannose-6-phosphate isomerase
MGAVPKSVSTWLVERFIPGWVARAWRPGLPGYVENVAWRDGAAILPQTFSTMVTGRLVYTFSLCHAAGAAASCLEAAAHGLDVLLGRARRSDGGFAHALALDGSIADPRSDLYDIAFVLLALGGYAAATGRRDILDIADSIGARLEADPSGGFREAEQGSGPRLQYPQMHLFEAFQLLARVAPTRGWEARADAIVDLAERRLIQPDGCINEWYDDLWHPAASDGDPERELGHQFEWAWLLYRHGRTSSVPRATALADRLYAYGQGVISSALGSIGPLPNRIDKAGHPRDALRPLWPLTELLRAATLAQPGKADAGVAAAALSAIFAHHIDPETGLWINALNAEDGLGDRAVPSRLLYHIVPALIAFARDREGAFRTSNMIFDRNAL